MKIDREEVFKVYMEWVDKVCEELDWKTNFTPKEIVYKICDIIEKDSLVGQSFNSAKKELNKGEYRIVKLDGKGMMITDDFRPDRLNLEIENRIITKVYEG